MPRNRSKPPSKRQLRVGEELRHALSRVLARGELHDPVLHDVPITVSEIRISPDLKNATAFVVPLGGDATADEAEVLAALKRAAPFLRTVMAREVDLRHVPRLTFEADDTFDEAQRISDLLRQTGDTKKGDG